MSRTACSFVLLTALAAGTALHAATPDGAGCDVEAIRTLREAPDAALLAACLERAGNPDARVRMARALWQARPDRAVAAAIVEVARRLGEPGERYELLDILDGPHAHALLSVPERLDYLLSWKIPRRASSVAALDIGLVEPVPAYSKPLLDDEDRTFLEAHRAEAVEFALRDLAGGGGNGMALLLGHFREPRALPELRRWFLAADQFYGWEATLPDALATNQFPSHHAYEQAIEAISGRPIEQFLTLTPAEVEALVAQWRSQASFPALYTLLRLRPELAREEAARAFRAAPAGASAEERNRFHLCIVMNDHFLAPALESSEVRRLLGKPDRAGPDAWVYECHASGWIVKQARLVLEFSYSLLHKHWIDYRYADERAD